MAEVMYLVSRYPEEVLTLHPLSTPNDVALFGYAQGYTDGGQVIVEGEDGIYVAYVLQLTRDDAYLTIGGDYSDKTGTDSYNLYLNQTCSGTQTPHGEVGAVLFAQNGHVNFAAQTGAKTAGSVKKAGKSHFGVAENFDENIRIGASYTYTMDSSIESPTVTAAYGINANGSLEVIGSVTGTIEADLTDSRIQYVYVDGSGEHGRDNSEDRISRAAGLRAPAGLTIGTNFQTTITAKTTNSITTFQNYDIPGSYWSYVNLDRNTSTAHGVSAGGSFIGTSCVWQGSVTTKNVGSEMLSIAENYHSAGIVSTFSFCSNLIAAYGVQADEDFSIDCFSGSEGNVCTTSAIFNGDCQGINTSGNKITFTDNTIAASGIAAANLSAANGAEDLTWEISASGNILSLTYVGINYNSTTTWTNNTISVAGFAASGNITLGDWLNAVLTVSATENAMTITAAKEAAPTVVVENNQIIASGIAASGNVTFGELKKCDLTVSADNNTAPLINAATISGDTVSFTNIAQDTQIGVALSNNRVDSYKNLDRKITGYGIKAATLTMNEYNGTVSLALTDNTDIISIQSAAIGVSGTFSVRSLKGKINVTESGTAFHKTYGSPTSSSVAGLKAANLTVSGIFATDFTVSSKIYKTVDANTAIDVTGKLTANAFSGTINADTAGTITDQWGIGIWAAEFVTAVKNDAFDVNGGIYGVATGIASSSALNLRVSGTIEAASHAILAENQYGVVSSSFKADSVQLSETAKITGHIDLLGGDNELLINSGATVNGNLLTNGGSLRLYFELGRVNENAVISTDKNDVTLKSTTYVAVNLNSAENGQTYTLFQFADDERAQWTNRRIVFLYNNQAYNLTTDYTGAIDADCGEFSVKFSYNANNTITVSAEGVVAPDQLDVSAVTTEYDAENATYTIDWSQCQWPALENWTEEIVELEYRLKDADGNFYGESIGVSFSNGETSFTLQEIGDGESVGWRLRRSNYNSHNDVTGWSDYQWDTVVQGEAEIPAAEDLQTVPDVSECKLQAGEPGDHASAAGGVIKTSVARLFWTSAQSETPLEHYTVEYVESTAKLTDQAAIEELFATQEVYSKAVTGTEVLVSSLTPGCYVYWRLKATDFDGGVSDYQYAQMFRVKLEDTTPPELGACSGEIRYSYVDGFSINADIAWAPAVDTQSGVYYYTLEYAVNGTEDWVLASTQNHDPDKTEYSFTINDLANEDYAYRIKAYDYSGNIAVVTQTDELLKDSTAPDMEEVKLTVDTQYDKQNPYQITVNAGFSWKPATDEQSGVQKYTLTYGRGSTTKTIEVSAADIDPETGEYTVAITDDYQNGSPYSYTLTATDYCGNVSTALTGTFGGDDVEAPTGAFTVGSMKATVTSVYTEKTYQETYVNPATLNTSSHGFETRTVTERVYTGATVKFTWSDTYTDTSTGDSPVCYRIQVSSSKDFADGMTYTFCNTPADGKSFTLGNDVPTMSVGVLAKLNSQATDGTLYWRVMAMDNPGNDAAYALWTSGNETGIWSEVKSFQFVDPENSEYINIEGAPAAATNITLKNTWDSKSSCYQSGTSCSFNVPNSGWGVQSIGLRLSYGGSGEYSPVASDWLDYDSVLVTRGTETATVTLPDTLDLADGYYTLRVVSRDALGQMTTSGTISYVVDTVAPTTVTGIQFAQSGADVTVSWNPSYDATAGVEYYTIGYRYKTTDDSAAWNWTNTSTTSHTFYTMASADYEFVIYAYDRAYADLGKSERNQSAASEIVSYSTKSAEPQYAAGNFKGVGCAFQTLSNGLGLLRSTTDREFLSGTLGNAANWEIVGVGNFDGNQAGKEGLLWQDLTTGELVMQNDMTSFAEVNNKTNVLGSVAAGYTAKATGDFSGSGLAGALLQTPAFGDTAVSTNYGLACFAREQSGDMFVGWLGALVNTWEEGAALKGDLSDLKSINANNYCYEVVGVGDFNGDGRDDVMLRNTMPEFVSQGGKSYEITGSGDVFTFLTGDEAAIKRGDAPMVCYVGREVGGWEVLGFGDFNGDGIDDALLSNGTDLAGWSMTNGQRQDNFWFGTLADGQEVAGIADFNNDGTDDILLRQVSTDGLSAWTVKNGVVTGTLALQ